MTDLANSAVFSVYPQLNIPGMSLASILRDNQGHIDLRQE